MGSGLEDILSLVYCGDGLVLAGGGSSSGDGDVYRSDVGFTQSSSGGGGGGDASTTATSLGCLVVVDS